jgi:colanic acid/amylovoran biosynthesis protein
MDEERPLFILAGNGPYANRGCEAIVRGTVRILRTFFNNPEFICCTNYKNEDQFWKQSREETDSAIHHISTCRIDKKKIIHNFWKPDIWSSTFNYFFRPSAFRSGIYREMFPYLERANAILSVGGDNYSLDYGELPTLVTDLDDIVLEKKKPLVIWGASVGPFNEMPDYEQYMSHHLTKVTGIFARESATTEYLKSIGVTENVYPVADPGFLMDPVKPEGIEDALPLEQGGIGLNLSPLMARYATGGNLEAWTNLAAAIITEVVQETEMPLYLIPHVTNPASNDHTFMQNVLSKISGKHGNITLIPAIYNAAETKWIVSQMDLFGGARTHSTIAALSSGVPTMSFAYSIKARGINRDIFGHESYCLNPDQLQPNVVTGKIRAMIENSSQIKTELGGKIPMMQERAMNAGKYLCGVLKQRSN